MEFVRNAWYCVGWSREFADEPVPQKVLGEAIVLYRTSGGALAALEDMCPHRFLPLSKGRRVGDAIQCGYHGMTFGADGRCVRIPGQERIPDSAVVRSYPVAEKHGVVWVWMGAPAAADITKIFDLPQFGDPGWAAHHGEALHLKSHYLNVAENLCDPAHISFVHPTTLGSSASENVPVETTRDGDVILTWRWIRDAPPVGFFQKFGGFSGNVDRWHYYYLHAPNVAAIDFGSAAVEAKLAEDERDKGVRIWALHFLTPVTKTYTIDRWMHLRNTALDEPGVEDRMDAMFRVAFAEDKDILETIQANELGAARNRRPVRIGIDLGPNLYRKAVAEMIAAERQTLAAAE